MQLFDNSKQSFSNNSNHNKREPIARTTTKNTNSLFRIKSSHEPHQNGTENIELFLRHRSEAYLSNFDYDTALFYAERLLSSADNLYNRLLVAKCYNSLTKYNRAYHVLQSIVRQTQTQYQRHLESQIKNRHANKLNSRKMSESEHDNSNDISFDIDPLTPNGKNPNNMSDIGFAFPTTTKSDRNSINNSNNNTEAFGGSFLRKPKTPNMKENMNMDMNMNMSGLNIDESLIKILFEARYFISLICFELGRYDECEEFLLGKKWSDSQHIKLTIPNGVFGIYLLAKVFHKSGRFDLAIKYYNKCIALDSYHFGAILALSELGKDPGLTIHSKPNQCLLSKDCVIPLNVNDEKKLIPLENVDNKSYNKVKSLFDNLSWGYFKLQMFFPQDALKYFNQLSESHFNSAWVLNNTARCYFEMNDHQRAICNWKKQLELYPYDITGMDYYSTALWQLKKSKELTLLSQHCSEIDKTSYLTWIVMGNCFSLHKSHDLAIKFFKKASIISGGTYAYSYTLAGHEYVVNEDFDSALESFENALRIDARHYNAWYGLANIYQFQQNYKDALYHFNTAIKINPNSSVLYVCMSSIYKLQSNYKLALFYCNKALSIGYHENLKARLEKANIYILMNEYKLAIVEFEKLLQIIPNEWKIHFHLGEVYLQINEKDLALLAFNRAMALNPKDKNTIKHAIQNVYSQNNNQTANRAYNNHNNNNNNNNNHNHNNNDFDDDNDDDMLDDSEVDDDDDDNDQFMNISRSHDISSSVNVIVASHSHSNSLSPQ